MVRLREPSAKHFWDGLERFDERLEELGVGDEDGAECLKTHHR